MAFVLPDRTRETLASAPGTGNATTAGATQGAQSIASKLTSNGDTTWATIDNGTAWETNTITRVSAGVYSRGTPFDSSNAGALVNFASGTLEIFPDLPASKAKVLERLAWSAGAILSVGDGTVSLPAWSFSNDTDCGLYRIGANNLGMALGGAKVVDYSTAGVAVTGTFGATSVATVGPSNTSANFADLRLYGGNAANGGYLLRFGANGTDDWIIGARKSLVGGGSTSANFCLYKSGLGIAHEVDFSTNAFTILSGGLIVGAPTGGDKGTGTINATALYDDNVLLTCSALQADYLEKGYVDTDRFDAIVPPRVTPERIEQTPLMKEVTVEREQLIPIDGGYQKVIETVQEPRQVTLWAPIYDADGNGLDAIEEEQFDQIVHPGKTEPRRHEVAHLFKAMISEGFDPRDPVQYIAKLKKDQALPGMPTMTDWQHGALSIGEIHSRHWLATEMLALAFIGLEARVAVLESR